jgi:hypothetical protein
MRIREIENQNAAYKGRIHVCQGDIRCLDLCLGRQEADLFDDVVEVFHLAAVYDLSVRREVGLANNLEGTCKVYHLSDPKPLLLNEAIDINAEVTERRVVRVKLPDWLVKGAMQHSPGLTNFVGIEPPALVSFTQSPRYRGENTLADLAGSGISCPPFASYAPKSVAFMQSHPEISPRAMV